MKYDEDETECYTLKLINEKHEFSIVETPTNVIHTAFLKQNELVDGITDH